MCSNSHPGTAYVTEFTFHCYNWSVPKNPSPSPFTYEFLQEKPDGSRSLLFKTEGNDFVIDHQLLPPGDVKNNHLLSILVSIRSHEGALTTSTLSVQVQSGQLGICFKECLWVELSLFDVLCRCLWAQCLPRTYWILAPCNSWSTTLMCMACSTWAATSPLFQTRR